MPYDKRPGSEMPAGRNFKGNRFAHLMKSKVKAKAKKPEAVAVKGKKGTVAAKKGPPIPPAAIGLAAAMRGMKVKG